MSRILCALILCALALTPAFAQDIVIQWEFNIDGDTGGWLPAHSLAPFTVKDGTLRTSVTGSDPYMHDSAGEKFEIDCNAFQYIEVRMRHTEGLSAEFFWANSTAGADAGFTAGKERGFPCLPDNEWHVYHVYPLWQGKVTRLRLDPPGTETGEIEIDYIRVIQEPPSTHDPSSPAWDFTSDNGGWIAIAGGTHLQPTPEGSATELLAEQVSLTSPVVDLKADDYRYAYVGLDCSEPARVRLSWSATDDGNFAACNLISFEAPAGASSANVPLSQNPMYAGEIKRLQLAVSASPGAKVTIKRMELAEKPLGPAKLKLISLAARPGLTITGTPGMLVATIRNDGGETLDRATLGLTVEGERVALRSPARVTVTQIGPGEENQLIWRYAMGAPGSATFSVTGPDGLTASTEVVASRPFPKPRTGAKPEAAVGSHAAWIGNDKVQLILTRTSDGFARGQLSAVEDGKPKVMAMLPHLAALALDGDEAATSLAFAEASAQNDEKAAVLTLKGKAEVNRRGVTYSLKLTLRPGKAYIDVDYELSAERDIRISAFRGPWLWAGEGSFGDKQDLALFPGVEYMVAGERSSSSLDIAPPKDIRFAPHPNTVTIPSMAVEKDGAIVGLMWDPLQKWDGENQKPTSVFASPNFLEGYANHLMGLCLPSIPEWFEPNQLLAAEPYPLKSGGSLKLSASIYAEAKSDVLRSVDLYFARYGVPELPPKPRSYVDTLEMGLKAYEDVLWVEDAKGWMGVVGWAPGKSQSVALLYTMASRALKDAQLAGKLTEKGLSIASKADLDFALNHFGAPCQPLEMELASGRGRAKRVPEDGKYTFQPAEDRLKVLGSTGSTAVGICARAIRPILQSALRTGDPEALKAGLKTLEYMKRFKVPRASQVWEVPVHTPDVLASGDACEVYLMAYKLTGDREHLKQAIYWARTGVPFIYMWQAPEQRDLMLGGSIAVFGASFYSGSWFARPVQWNGLEYARVLLELDRYDKSMPWRHIAEMITISAMNQQTTREKDYGTYTDNWDVIDDIECVVCMLAPGRVMLNAMQLMDRPVGSRTDVVRTDDGPISITSAALASGIKLEGGILSASLRYDEGYSAYTALMPVAEPTQVEVDGAELARRPSPVDTDEGWSYDSQIGCLTLKLAYGKSPRSIRIIKTRRVQLELPRPAWEFSGEKGTEGWASANHVAPLEASGGKLIVKATGGDPYIYGPSISVDATEAAGIFFRAKATRPDGQLFFSTDSGFFAPERSVSFKLPADGEFHEVSIDLHAHKEWKGTIQQLRLDFASAPCDVEIDWVRLLDPTPNSK